MTENPLCSHFVPYWSIKDHLKSGRFLQMNRHWGQHIISTSHPTCYCRDLGRTLYAMLGFGGRWTGTFMAKTPSYRESFFLSEPLLKNRSSGVNFDCPVNYSGLFQEDFCGCCCCLDPALPLSARFCFLTGIGLCASRYCVTSQLIRDVDSVARGLGLCRDLVVWKTNISAKYLRKKFTYDTFCSWEIRVLVFSNFVWNE